MSLRRLPVLALVSSLALAGLAATPAGASPDGLRLIRTRQSLLGSHQWYEQTYRGLPVLDGYYAKHLDRAGNVVAVGDGRLAVSGDVAEHAAVTRAQAESAARSAGAEGEAESTLSVLSGSPSRLVWSVVTVSASNAVRTIVDATTGRTLGRTSLIKRVDGTGQVFHPNAVVDTHNEQLRDRADQDYGLIHPAYRTVTLTNLDGSGWLRGDYAFVASGFAYSPSNTFVYDRSQKGFEETTAYAAVTEAQLYIQSLGFTDVNNEPQKLFVDTVPYDNSFYIGERDTITFGEGGVDDAEDMEVVWHELGHAIQDDQVPNFGANHDAGSIGEAFGDYWASSMSEASSNGYGIQCIAEWDSTSYTAGPHHCLRRVDTNLTLADQNGEVHHDGQIWSRALYDINQDLGREVADTIILESQFSFHPRIHWDEAAAITVRTAKLLYGPAAAAVARQAFEDRGIL